MDSDSDNSIPGTPPGILETARLSTLNLLPQNSREKYENAYKRFMDYRTNNKTNSFSENVLIAYFADLCQKMKPLWSNYSMVRSTLSINNNVDISKYQKLRALLKRQSDGYKPKKSKILTKQQIETFMEHAPDDTYLMAKVC